MQKTQGGLGRGLGALLPQHANPQMYGQSSAVHTAAPEPASAPTPIPMRQTPFEPSPTVSVAPVPRIHGRLMHISPNNIVANPRQPRLYFAEEDLTDLMASVKEHGILQPLVVTLRGDGKYELIAGERRLRSARAVGLETVPVIVREANDQQKLELALIENIQRSDLNAVEEARAYQSMMDDFALTQEDVAGRVGKSRSQIANTVRLLDLPADMLVAVIDGRLTKSHARTLLSELNDAKRRDLFDRMIGSGMSVRSAESSTSRRQSTAKDPNILALESALREKLGTKVTIDTKGTNSSITIHCYSKEDLAAMIRRLNG